MAESYSIEAVLSARDEGFTKGMDAALKSVNSFSGKIKSGIGFGFLMSIGNQAFGALSNGFRSLNQNLASSTAAWKTFSGNMRAVHGDTSKTDRMIVKTRKDLEQYAQATIYDSSDMAQTFAQLDAVGTKHTAKLVKAFGNLAGAAEDPKQAMKTLSQQATQMAAKPKVAWQDFKLMMEQTPAGIAQVAKVMGKSTKELVADVQAGKISTDDFFKAVEKAGNSDAMKKQAAQYKTVGQAMDGLSETISNVLQPAFEVLSDAAAGAISDIIDALGKIDASALGKKMGAFIKKCSGYWEVFKDDVKKVADAFASAFSAIGGALADLNGAFGSAKSVDTFKDAMDGVTNALVGLANFCKRHNKEIAWLIKQIPKLAAAFVGFKIVSKIAGPMTVFAKGVGKLAKIGFKALAKKLGLLSLWTTKTGTAAAEANPNILKEATAFMALGVGVALCCVGIALLVQSAIALANAGPAAVLAVGALSAVILILVAAFANLGPQLTGNAVGMLAFGAALLLCSVGMALLSQAAIGIANAGPGAIQAIVVLGVVIGALALVFAVLGPLLTANALGILAFGVAVVLIGVGVLAACYGLTMLINAFSGLIDKGPQTITTMKGMVKPMKQLAPAALVAGAAMIIFGVGCLLSLAGIGTLAVTLLAVNKEMKAIKGNATAALTAITAMKTGLGAIKDGFGSVKEGIKSTFSSILTGMNNLAGKATAAGQRVGANFAQGITPGFAKAKSAAASAVISIISRLKSGVGQAQSAGRMIGAGLAAGMNSALGMVRAAADRLVAQANRAIRAKAKIHSPSRVMMENGRYITEGFALGIREKAKEAIQATADLFQLPRLETANIPNLALAGGYSGSLEGNYQQFDANYTIEVPVKIDGRQVAKATAVYTQAELDKNAMREGRKRGER